MAIEKGKERRERKGYRERVSGGVCEIQLRRPATRKRERNEGASREGKDVGREGRNSSLMQWWGGSYVR